MTKLYYLVTNNGDGSAGVEWYKEKPDLDMLMDKEPETYQMTDGVCVINLPDHINIDTIGIDFHTQEED